MGSETVRASGLMRLDAARRDAILNAALREFTTRGYDGASTNVIAREANISKALMFHYVGSKRDLLLSVCDCVCDILRRDYFERLDCAQRDIFRRLRQSFHLQIALVGRYPQILAYAGLFAPTGVPELDDALRVRADLLPASCDEWLFLDIDESRFRSGLDTRMCKRFIAWSCAGLAARSLEELRGGGAGDAALGRVTSMIDEHLDELENVFYGAGALARCRPCGL